MLPLLTLTLLLLNAPASDTKFPDWVRMKKGRTISGRVLSETKDAIVLRSGRGEVEVDREDVAEVHSLEHSFGDCLRRWDSMRHDDVTALSELAQFCAGSGLEGESRILWTRVLIVDPQNEAAGKAIGARKIAGKWEIEADRRWVPFAEYCDPKPKWRDAVSLQTTHFLLRSDVQIERMLDAMFQLERHYQRFYGFLGPELGLFIFDEVPEVYAYSSARDYPQPPTAGETSWFEPFPNRLHVLVRDGLNMHDLVFDITQQLLYNAFRRSAGKNGEIAPWASRGISEYFAATSGSKLGEPWPPLGTQDRILFNMMADDTKPLPLDLLLRTALSEYTYGPYGAHRSAGAYTLVSFLLDGDGGSHREAFYRFLRDAWLGRTTSSLLYKSLGMKAEELEKRWRAFVRGSSGKN